ncbi:adhesion G-protein coupled receptor G6-like [Puntigrus tetrazona]|uniref:adhesion G-protein coupled receptor G6-like n=1 Tax=Puntigrus tetrazona TaxID=1606681 RepID=UPI001C89DA68|nr:adhesion G-protein coupled receptor G6-like [Puntigrus tetrazona]
MSPSLDIISRQKQNLPWMMIIFCATCQTTSLDQLIIQVNTTDQCFRDNSNFVISDINPASSCQSAENNGNFKKYIKLSISSQANCRPYSFFIINHGNDYHIRMNETVEGMKLWLLPNGRTGTCQIQQNSCIATESNELNVIRCSPCSFIPSDTALQSTPLEPNKSCANAIYNTSSICNDELGNPNPHCGYSHEGSRYVLSLIKKEWTCVKCDNTTDEESSTDSSAKVTNTSSTTHTTRNNPTTSTRTRDSTTTTTNNPTSMHLNLTLKATKTTNSTNTVVGGYTKALEALNNLEPKMEELEKSNKSDAMIVTEDGVGFLHVQAKNTETKDINICYSSDDAMVVEGQSDLIANCSWSVKISKEAFDQSRHQNNGSAFVGVLRLNNLRNKNETENEIVLNNEVYGITMKADISNLTDNIVMFFTPNGKVGKASCSSWDGKVKHNWTTFGCETIRINNTIKCSCSHLTFFAVLMSQSDSILTEKDLETLTYITYIGCGISMFFLSIALFMHFLLRKAKSNQATKILMNMFVSLFLLNASFLSNESVANTQDNAACVFIALLLHYSMLASFTWFFIQALHMYLWLIRQNVTITNYMRKITVLGWVFPAPIVIAIVSVEEYKTVTIKTPAKNSKMCWITNPYIHYIVNIGYYALVFIFTTGIFITIVTRIVHTRRLRAIDGKRKTFRKQLMMVLSLFLLFGLTWSVAFFSYGPMLIPSYYIFTVFNSFQGFFLFLYYHHIHNDFADFSDDPRTTIVKPNGNGLQNVYN